MLEASTAERLAAALLRRAVNELPASETGWSRREFDTAFIRAALANGTEQRVAAADPIELVLLGLRFSAWAWEVGLDG